MKDIFKRHATYKYFTKLNISMQYYTFKLYKESSLMCVLVTPFGKYQRTRVLMGLKPSADWAQATMEEVFNDILHLIECFFDDIGIFSNDWDQHITLVSQFLKYLEDNGSTVNPFKCDWAVQETDWLDYWMTPEGYKPWYKKIELVLTLDQPTNPKEF